MSDDPRLVYPVPKLLRRAEVTRALAELGLVTGQDRIRTVTIGWHGVRVELRAETPDGCLVRNLDGDGLAHDVVTIPIVEG